MTVNTESLSNLEYEPVVQTPPSFFIDQDAEDSQIAQLQVDGVWLMSRPATRLLALRKFADNPDTAGEDSPWRRLTDRENAKYFWFDKETEIAVRSDERYSALQKRRTEMAGSEKELSAMLAVRVRYLEIFLERAKTIKMVGNVSLAAYE